MNQFNPHLNTLPPPQRAVWDELHTTPEHFTLYGGTAIALYLGHRESVDFDFFSREPIRADDLLGTIPYLKGAELLDSRPNTLTCRIDRDGKVKMQFFGGLPIGSIEPRQQPNGSGFWVAAPIDLAASKVKVLPERAEEKDYLDVYALIRNGITLPMMLSAARMNYGPSYNAVVSLKALSYFGDVPNLSDQVKTRLSVEATTVDLSKLPNLKSVEVPFAKGNTL